MIYHFDTPPIVTHDVFRRQNGRAGAFHNCLPARHQEQTISEPFGEG
jgi:hypothetical protein